MGSTYRPNLLSGAVLRHDRGMAGMSITVCLPGTAAGRVDEAVKNAMAPFEVDYTSGEELAMWDHARICGGADGHGFPVLPAHEGDPRLIHDRPRHDGTLESSRTGMCAGGPRELLDFNATRAEAEEVAGEAWDVWHSVPAHHPPAESQTSLYRRTGLSGPRYWNQPLLRAFEEKLSTLRRAHRTHRFSSALLSSTDPVEDIGAVSRAKFVAWQGDLVPSPRNVLSLDGWWYEVGDVRLHGACHSPAQCQHEPDVGEGQATVAAYLAGVSADTLLVHVHCHV
ncbi:hypothetical protein OG803_38930 (plasmid) [Streptomyces sp. NBC_00467]